MKQMKIMLGRLKKPSVVLSVVSQILSLLLIFGVKIDENLVMQIAVILCSIFVTLGVMQNPDTQKKGYGDDILKCSRTGEMEPHVMVDNRMVCVNCGTEYTPDNGGRAALN